MLQNIIDRIGAIHVGLQCSDFIGASFYLGELRCIISKELEKLNVEETNE